MGPPEPQILVEGCCRATREIRSHKYVFKVLTLHLSETRHASSRKLTNRATGDPDSATLDYGIQPDCSISKREAIGAV